MERLVVSRIMHDCRSHPRGDQKPVKKRLSLKASRIHSQYCPDLQRRRPLVFQNVQTDPTKLV